MPQRHVNRKQRTRQDPPQMVPRAIPGEPDLVQVDITWGELQPMEPVPGVRAIGELEVLEHLRAGRPVVDSRTANFYAEATLPGALSIPHTEAADRAHELDRSRPTLLFCNGPQCPQSPTAIRALVEAGYPADKILYYRGGMHDWRTLGLPTEPGEPE